MDISYDIMRTPPVASCTLAKRIESQKWEHENIMLKSFKFNNGNTKSKAITSIWSLQLTLIKFVYYSTVVVFCSVWRCFSLLACRYNTFTCHKQICFCRLGFERYFAHHQYDVETRISWKVASLNSFVHDLVNLLYCEHWTEKLK